MPITKKLYICLDTCLDNYIDEHFDKPTDVFIGIEWKVDTLSDYFGSVVKLITKDKHQNKKCFVCWKE